MLLAVENNRTDDFSLVENEEKNQQVGTFDSGSNHKSGFRGLNRLRKSVDSIEDIDESRSSSQPRYLSKYVSKRTQKRQNVIEEEKAAQNRPITSAEKKERAAKVKESLVRQEHYIEQQKKKREE